MARLSTLDSALRPEDLRSWLLDRRGDDRLSRLLDRDRCPGDRPLDARLSRLLDRDRRPGDLPLSWLLGLDRSSWSLRGERDQDLDLDLDLVDIRSKSLFIVMYMIHLDHNMIK